MHDPDISTNDGVIPKYDKMVVVGAILCGTQISLPTTTLYPNMIEWWWWVPSCAGPRDPYQRQRYTQM